VRKHDQKIKLKFMNPPCFAPSFHVIGQGDIVGPDIKLPLP